MHSPHPGPLCLTWEGVSGLAHNEGLFPLLKQIKLVLQISAAVGAGLKGRKRKWHKIEALDCNMHMTYLRILLECRF